MIITVKKLPVAALTPYPTYENLWQAYYWWLSADHRWRERFVQSRLDIVKRYAGTVGRHQEQRTSGTTGLRKHYKWGPNFVEVDKFFYSLVRRGGKPLPTAHILANTIRDWNGENKIVEIKDCTRYDIQRHIFLQVNGKGKVDGLSEALRGHHVFLSASAFSLIDNYTSFSEDFDKNGLVIFTGESLPTETKKGLVDKGFDVRDQMRCWDGGATFVTCPFGNQHWIDFLAVTTTDQGKLISNDLFNLAQPHLSYWNGDVVMREFGESCACGERCCKSEFANRCDNTAFHTQSGKVLAYETVYDAFWINSGLDRSQILALCFGRYRGDVDYKLRINYLTTSTPNEDQVRWAFFEHLGLRIELVSGILPDQYKLRKIYYIDE
jgi:hypothetical protein